MRLIKNTVDRNEEQPNKTKRGVRRGTVAMGVGEMKRHGRQHPPSVTVCGIYVSDAHSEKHDRLRQ